MVPLKSIIDDGMRAEENNRKDNEGIGIDNSAQIYDENKFQIVVRLISMPFILRILPCLEWALNHGLPNPSWPC